MKQAERIQAQTNQEFVNVINKKFKNWCSRMELEPTPENMIKYLMDCSVVEPKTVNRYMTLELYPRELYRHDCCKRKAVMSLTLQVPYEERTIWYIIGDMIGRYKPSNSVKFLDRTKLPA